MLQIWTNLVGHEQKKVENPCSRENRYLLKGT